MAGCASAPSAPRTQRGASIALQNSVGSTALTYAAVNGHEQIVDLLLQRGAAVDQQNSFGTTALIACAGNKAAEALMLVESPPVAAHPP